MKSNYLGQGRGAASNARFLGSAGADIGIKKKGAA
jgi:hypothetical protein